MHGSTAAGPGALGLPLAGIRVLDFTHFLAGPFCTRLLADLGADVVKVESSLREDRLGAVKYSASYRGRTDRPPTFLNTNRNKRSIVINLKTSAGRDLARALAQRADVLVENFSASVMVRLGLGYADLCALNPRLIYLSMSGYGHSGPRRDWTSMNSNLQAYSGLMMVTGAEGDRPISISNSWNDYMGGLHGCVAVLDALRRRAADGIGANIDMAQFEASVATLGALLIASAVTGSPPRRLGNRSLVAAPQGCYRCAGEDEWCVISVQSDVQWQALLAAVPELGALNTSELSTVRGRTEHHDAIDARIQAWTSTQRTQAVEARLQAAGVPAERMRRVKDTLESPDSGHSFTTVEDPPGWNHIVTGVPFGFSRSQTSPQVPAPRLGEHTQAVLSEWLGLSNEVTTSLKVNEVLV